MQLSNVIDRAVPALPTGAAVLQVLTLGLERETFALETEMVREVLDRVPISEVPNARPFVRGLINVRGKVVPVVDLKRKFGMGATEATTDSRVIVPRCARCLTCARSRAYPICRILCGA